MASTWEELLQDTVLRNKARLVNSICLLTEKEFDNSLMELPESELRNMIDDIIVMSYLKRHRPDLYAMMEEE